MLPTPQAHDFKRGKTPEQVETARAKGAGVANLNELVENTLLPTPVAHLTGNTPEDHLARKPGRKQVTDLGIIVENGLLTTGGMLPTGGSTPPPSTDGLLF